MEDRSLTTPAYDEVLTKIGRNLVMFQKAEIILKEIIRLGGSSVTLKLDQTTPVLNAPKFEKMTLGNLSNEFLNRHCPEKVSEKCDPTCITLSTGFSLDWSESEIERLKRAFDDMVNERNGFIHSPFLDLDPADPESCRRAADMLDQQRERLLPTIDEIRSLYTILTSAIRELFEQMSKPGYLQNFDLEAIRTHPIMESLRNYALGDSGNEWHALGKAAKSTGLSDQEVAEICQNHSQPNLTAMVAASGLFNIQQEQTGPARHRVLYQLKQDIP